MIRIRTHRKVSQTPSDDKQTSSENKKTDDTETQDKSNVFQVGDVVETEDFKITFVSAGNIRVIMNTSHQKRVRILAVQV